jgi:hypothetical protein
MEGGNDYNDRDEIFSKVIRAGKRTYFFDVKSTRGNDLYLTITESKKRFHDDGDSFYEKHKIFLYKEDFDKFGEGFKEALTEIERLRNEDDKYANPSDSEDVENDSMSSSW